MVVLRDLAEPRDSINLMNYFHDCGRDKALPRFATDHAAPDLGAAVPITLVHRGRLHLHPGFPEEPDDKWVGGIAEIERGRH